MRLALLAVAGCATPAASRPELMQDVAYLAKLDGRAAGSSGEVIAADYVAVALRQLDLAPQRQALTYPADSANVYALLPGATDEVIVIGAHLDHLGPGFPGADDNASGVAAVLGIARALRHERLGRSILFVFFAAEEQGLLGSKQLVAAPPVPLGNIKAMVNLDMVGRPLLDAFRYRAPLFLVGIDRDRSVGLVGARSFPGLRALVDRAFGSDEVVAAEDLPDLIGREVEAQSQGRSDSASFERAGIPSLFFGDGESSDYHAKGDTVTRLKPWVLERRARAIAEVVRRLANAPAEAFARSGATPPKRKPRPGFYLPIGVQGGVSSEGVAFGAEASLVYFRPTWFAGVSADALYVDGGRRIAVGPELGIGPFGVELDTIFTETSRGVAVRPFASLGVLALALRVGNVEGEGWFGDLTVSVKLPVFLHR